MLDKKFYVENGGIRKICLATDMSAAAQILIIDMVDHFDGGVDVFHPFIIVSERGYMGDMINVFGDVTDEMRIMLTYNVIKSVSELSQSTEERERWLALRDEMEIYTNDFNDTEEYHQILDDLI
jgi:hypothetical protein